MATTERCARSHAARTLLRDGGIRRARRPSSPLLTSGSTDCSPGAAPTHGIRVEPSTGNRRTTERLRTTFTGFRAPVHGTHVGASKITHVVIQHQGSWEAALTR